jgi:hypothetical protein
MTENVGARKLTPTYGPCDAWFDDVLGVGLSPNHFINSLAPPNAQGVKSRWRLSINKYVGVERACARLRVLL